MAAFIVPHDEQLEKEIVRIYGKRCKKFVIECTTCVAWKLYDLGDWLTIQKDIKETDEWIKSFCKSKKNK